MIQVTHEELQRLIRISYYSKRPLIVVGPVGVGKSMTIKDTAKKIAKELELRYTDDWNHINDPSYFVLIEQRATRFDPSDIRGLPNFQGNDTVWKKPSWIPKQGQGIIFLEELTQAPPLIQTSLQSLLLTRAVEERKIPDGYGLIAATNRPEDDAAVFDVPANIKNRLLWCELSPPSAESWCAWAAKNNIHPTIIAAVYRNPHWLFDEKVSPQTYAFRRPRTWEFLSDLIYCCEKLKEEVTEEIVATAIGEGAAAEFMTYIRLHEKMKDFRKILDGEAEPPTELDLLTAVISNVVEFYRTHKDQKTMDKILRLCSRIKEPEFGVLLAKMCKNLDGSTFIKLATRSKEAQTFTERFGKYLFD